MNKYLEYSLKASKKIYQKIYPLDSFGLTNDLAQFTGQSASDIIKEKLMGDKPVMIGRFGMVELHCLLNNYYVKQKKALPQKIFDYISGRSFPFWWDSAVAREMRKNAGFINPTVPKLERFCELMQNDMKQVDVLASWIRGEQVFYKDMSPDISTISIWFIEPFKSANPWSEALKGKTVLVVHPYEESIQKQYANREKLFSDPRVLPEFNLKTIKAIQSIAYNETEYKNWFEALDFMKKQISETEFDIAIIGCGAYGFPLAAHVKRMGKKAVHLGGATQVLFGISGRRWEDDPSFKDNYINEYWVKPNANETPKQFSKIEDGCYW
jgi:hypothetical protein